MRVLLTAFEPYDEWADNSSWLTLVDLLKDHPTSFELVTRRYPVDLPALQAKLSEDLASPYDAVLHLGQAPGASCVKLEAIALNIAGRVEDHGEELACLIESAPLAFRSQMPIGRWAEMLRQVGIPAKVSYHAGTFLCNATMYLTHHWVESRSWSTQVGFVHLPLAAEQVAAGGPALASLPAATLSRAVRLLLEDLASVSKAGSPAENVA